MLGWLKLKHLFINFISSILSNPLVSDDSSKKRKNFVTQFSDDGSKKRKNLIIQSSRREV